MRVLDQNGAMLGIMPTSQAQRLADGQGLDLVEITPNAVPPVCKIMDYGKFRYEESIRAKKARRKRHGQSCAATSSALRKRLAVTSRSIGSTSSSMIRPSARYCARIRSVRSTNELTG